MVEFSPHIALDVTDLSNATTFYRDTLDMDVKLQSEAETELRCGEVTLYVQEADEPRTYLEFSTDDLDALVTDLRDENCDIREAGTPEGDTSYLVHDPYGCNFHVFEKS